jgi:two-component system, NarL family, nitrate/nitrite response regulator NarL
MLVDDHALFRESVARLLAAEPTIRVVAQCGSTEDACRILKTSKIDLILLDFDLGDRDCTAFMLSAGQLGFRGKILLVTAGVPENKAAELIRRGISGVFTKQDSPGLLLQAIQNVMDGKVWFTQRFLQSTLAVAPQVPARKVQFTERERQVLDHVLEGLSNKEIADRLSVSETAVKASLQNLFGKTGVRTRSELVRALLENYKDLL